MDISTPFSPNKGSGSRGKQRRSESALLPGNFSDAEDIVLKPRPADEEEPGSTAPGTGAHPASLALQVQPMLTCVLSAHVDMILRDRVTV